MTRQPEPTLLETQRWVKAHVLPRASEGQRQRAEAGVALNLQRGVPGAERLAVYAGGYLARTHASLLETYPAVRQVLGAAAFRAMSEAYARAHPSHDTNLSLMGRALPVFLSRASQADRLPFLPDLATLEWLVGRAFHAFDRPPLEIAQVRQLSPAMWAQTRIMFQPSVGLIASAWPILDIWEARTQPRHAINIDLVNRPQQILVARCGTQVQCERLEPASAQVLRGLMDGQTIGEVCQVETQEAGDRSQHIAGWFQGWAQAGLMVEWQVLKHESRREAAGKA